MRIKSYKTGMLWTCVVLLMTSVSMLTAKVIGAEEACVASYELQYSPKEAPPADPYADAQILVEAFVVEVTTAGLKDLGISPLGQTPDGISIAKLTNCLMKEKDAKVISGAKVTVKQKKEGAAKEQKTIYVKEKWRDDIRYMNYNLEKLFIAKTNVVSDNNISVEYNYSESGPQIDPNYDPNTPSPQTKFVYNWNGQFNLQSNKPKIAAAVQNKDNVVFLVLTVTIQKDTPIENQAAEERKEKSK